MIRSLSLVVLIAFASVTTAAALDAGAPKDAPTMVLPTAGPFDAAPALALDAAALAGTGPATFDAPAPVPAQALSPDEPNFWERMLWLWRSGAGIPVAILGLFGAAMVASRKIAWLRQDHRAVYVAATIAGLGKLAEIAATGQTPNQNAIIGAFTGLWLLVIRAQPAPTEKAPESTRAITADTAPLTPEPADATEPPKE